jgi:hypothetical protein
LNRVFPVLDRTSALGVRGGDARVQNVCGQIEEGPRFVGVHAELGICRSFFARSFQSLTLGFCYLDLAHCGSG